jgi:hypothetical protein
LDSEVKKDAAEAGPEKRGVYAASRPLAFGRSWTAGVMDVEAA